MMIDLKEIKAARILAGMKQTELAEESKISVNALQNIENGFSNPKYNTVISIKKSLEKKGIIFSDSGIKLARDQE